MGTVVAVVLLLTLLVLLGRRLRRNEPVTWVAISVLLLVIGGITSYPYAQLTLARPAVVAGDLEVDGKFVLITAM